jgi:sugar phosphate isomerase/epimerase
MASSNKISMGIWGNTNLRDRFNVNGFGEDVPVLERIREVVEIDGIEGIELHLPTEIYERNAGEIEKALNDYGLRIVQLCGHTWTDRELNRGILGLR